MHAIGYIRVSTDKQAERGLSLDAQREKLRAMAVVHDTELAEIIVDAESAKNLDRPGMKRILDLVRGGGVDTVIVAKLDRLTRSVRDLVDLWICSNGKASPSFRSLKRWPPGAQHHGQCESMGT
jgi:site-specific DNA recombinase